MQAERGFTLLEVLVAFIIAALALGALFQGTMAGLQSVRVSGEYEEAVSRARSHLAAVGQSSRLMAGEQQGDDGRGFHWRVRVVPAGSVPVAHGDAVTVARGPRAILYAIEVTVSWHDGNATRDVRLESRRGGSAPAAPP